MWDSSPTVTFANLSNVRNGLILGSYWELEKTENIWVREFVSVSDSCLERGQRPKIDWTTAWYFWMRRPAHPKVAPPYTPCTFDKTHPSRRRSSSYPFSYSKLYDWSTLMKIKIITTTLVSGFMVSLESSDGDRDQVVGLDQQNKPTQMH